MGETHSRSVIKGISWRVLATLTTMILVYVFTGDLGLTAGIGALEFTAKLVLYYLHECGWNRVGWGRLRHSDFRSI